MHGGSRRPPQGPAATHSLRCRQMCFDSTAAATGSNRKGKKHDTGEAHNAKARGHPVELRAHVAVGGVGCRSRYRRSGRHWRRSHLAASQGRTGGPLHRTSPVRQCHRGTSVPALSSEKQRNTNGAARRAPATTKLKTSTGSAGEGAQLQRGRPEKPQGTQRPAPLGPERPPASLCSTMQTELPSSPRHGGCRRSPQPAEIHRSRSCQARGPGHSRLPTLF